jgi:NAD(P)-dependent dehydrogenase (short-subunit alcohol dehydrogenase family)
MNMATSARRTAIVTGGGSGIGRATALRLADDGCDVLVADVQSAGADVAAEIAAAGGRARFVRTDVTDASSLAAMLGETVESFGPPAVLVAAAAVLGEEHATGELPADEFRRVLEINLTGVLLSCQAVLPHMLERGFGRIVAISSNARHGAPRRAAYAASKAGLVALVTTIAHEYARAGVLANCIDPGRALTPMIVPRYDAAYLADPPGVAIGRLAQPAEIADVIAFLCSARNTYAVGALWEATGGLEIG